MDDRRVGRVIREVRVRRGWRQRDLAAAAGLSQALISRIELGRLEQVSLQRLRTIGATLDIVFSIGAWWRSGELGIRRPVGMAGTDRRGFGGIWFLPYQRLGSDAGRLRQVQRVRRPTTRPAA